ncbi:MAG: CBS domain-containing protein [Gammaproteobacteria bacterium]|nr:CBS domain-containing protein [Gammaproteobacteria bacterium]
MTLGELLRIKGTKEVLKMGTNDSIAKAATLMTENKVGALLVEDANAQIVGILSERDIVGGMGKHGADLHDVRVTELMTADPIRCCPSDTVLQAMAMMTDRRFRHLPVFDDEKLVGFISIGDLVKCRIAEVQLEAEAMRQYIAS